MKRAICLGTTAFETSRMENIKSFQRGKWENVSKMMGKPNEFKTKQKNKQETSNGTRARVHGFLFSREIQQMCTIFVVVSYVKKKIRKNRKAGNEIIKSNKISKE